MNVLVTGDRKWSNKALITATLDALPEKPDLIIEGGASGADMIAGEYAYDHDIPLAIEQAKWDRYGIAAGPVRNKLMFDKHKPNLVLAFHNDLNASKGTKNMVEYAQKKGCEVRVISEPKKESV